VNAPQEALQAIRDSGAEAIVTKHDLELVRFLRSHKASPNRDIVIILVTGDLGTDDILAERDSGVTEIVAKPASVDRVIGHVYEALTHPRRFIDAKAYHGPDRRRRMSPYTKRERRGSGKAAVSDES
jgi:two-component system chemotaxis response regulator CheY